MVNSDCLICDYLRSEFPTKWNGTKSPILNNARFQAIADACIIIVIIIAFARHRREHLQSSTYVETHGCWQLRQRVYFSIDFASFWTRRARPFGRCAFSGGVFAGFCVAHGTWNCIFWLKKSGPFSLIILIISPLIYYKRHWMKASSSWNQQNDLEASLKMRVGHGRS